jgi:putative bacteriocin precursor
MENNLRGGYCMNKLRKKMITETETLEAYAANCQTACERGCSGPCSAHITAGYQANIGTAYNQMY